MSSNSLTSAGAGGKGYPPALPGSYIQTVVYNSFTPVVSGRSKIASIVGDMLTTKDLLHLELSCKSSYQNFARYVSSENHGRHRKLVLHSKESLIFHNLFSPSSHRTNTLHTLITLIRKGRAFEEAAVIHQDLIPFAKKIVAKLRSEDWNMSTDQDILAQPVALELFAEKNFEKLMSQNRNSKEVFNAILPRYIKAWNEGGDNNITSYLGRVLLADEEVAFSLLTLEPHFFFDLSLELQARKDLVMLACNCDAVEEVFIEPQMFLSCLSEKWLDDDDVMTLICSRFGSSLAYASARLQDYKPLVALAVANDPDALEYASDRLREDLDILRPVLEKKPKNIQYAGDKARSNEELAAQVFSEDPDSLRFILNASFVLSIVSKDLSYIQSGFVSHRLIEDFDFMARLCIENEEAIIESDVLDESLYSSREFALAVLPHNPIALRSLHPMCLIDLDLVTVACDVNPQVLKYVTHKEIILHVIKKNPLAGLFIHDEVRKDYAFMDIVMKYI